jgi:hypothetical protein
MGPGTVFAHDGECRGYETLATTAVIGFTSSYYNLSTNSTAKMAMKAALITVETDSIRFSMSSNASDYASTTAGGAVGHKMDPGQSYVVRGWENIRNFRCINDVASSGAVVKCSFFY